MKKLLAVLCLIALPVSAGAKTCIDTREIAKTDFSHDGRSLQFTLKNGRSFRNELESPCPNLTVSGFVWVLRNGPKVCDSETSIRLILTGDLCKIGKFSPVTPGG